MGVVRQVWHECNKRRANRKGNYACSDCRSLGNWATKVRERKQYRRGRRESQSTSRGTSRKVGGHVAQGCAVLYLLGADATPPNPAQNVSKSFILILLYVSHL